MSRILQDGTVQTTGKELRRAQGELSVRGGQAMLVLERFESIGVVDRALLCRLANQSSIHLIGFSCLGTYKGRQELIPDLEQTYFFRSRKTMRRAQALIEALRVAGVEVSIEIFLSDLEPRRTWGWGLDQDVLTYYCQCMREEAQLPYGWQVTLWSELEASLFDSIEFESWVTWAQENSPLLIAQVEDHLRKFDMIEFPHGVRWSASRQVAAYAMEGFVLEQLRASAILMQSEQPYHRKDRLYQPRRTQPLPIIHPFSQE